MTDSMNDIDLSRDILNQFFADKSAFYRLPRERISDLLLSQLFVCEKLRLHNIFYITYEIKYLEGITGVTRTAKEKPFNGDILKGLWKKHFYSNCFIPKNLANFLSIRAGEKAFYSYIREAMQDNQSDLVEEKTLWKISDFASYGAYKIKASHAGERKGAFTGEWLIYGKYGDLNYYLCIARHNAGDENIRREIENVCVDEFPFLFESWVEHNHRMQPTSYLGG